MKLEGSLDAFSLADIFQLLSFTKKTGALHLANDGSHGVVFFAGGQITGSSADSSRQPLARRLVGTGAVDDEALAAAVGVAAAGESRGVVGALLEAGAVDAEVVRKAAAEQSVDAIFDLLRWRSGDFAFVVDEPNPDDVGITVTIEDALKDVDARKAGWESVSAVVPSAQAVLTMPVVLAEDPAVSRTEWSLLALVDSRRTVAELVDLTGNGQYAVVSTLAALVERGLLEVRAGTDGSEDDGDHVATVLRRQRLLAPLEAFVPVVEPAAPTSSAPTEETAPEAASAEAAPDEVAPSGADEAGPPAQRDGHGATSEAPAQDAGLVTTATAPGGQATMLGGAHVPQDVVPPRPEPFLPRRQADFDETAGDQSATVQAGAGGANDLGGIGDIGDIGDIVGATVTAPDPDATAVIQRDPNVNRSLMLRLIAGVRGL